MEKANTTADAERQINAARRQLSDHIEKFKIDREKTQEIAQDLNKTWSISLSVANGTGLVALGSTIVKADKIDLWLATLPAMWIFAAGIIVAGLIPLFQSKMHENMSQSFSILQILSQYTQDGIIPSNFDQQREENRRHGHRVAKFYKLSQASTYISSVLFSLGVLWPLTILTFKIQV